MNALEISDMLGPLRYRAVPNHYLVEQDDERVVVRVIRDPASETTTLEMLKNACDVLTKMGYLCTRSRARVTVLPWGAQKARKPQPPEDERRTTGASSGRRRGKKAT